MKASQVTFIKTVSLKNIKKTSQVTFIKIINLKSINKSTLGNFNLDNTPKNKKQVSSTYDTLKKRCIKIVDTYCNK